MKYTLTFLTALLLAPVSTAIPAIIAAIGFAAAARAEPPNPGFEDGKDGALKCWTLESKPIPVKDGVRNATNVRAVWDTGSRSGGQRCLRMQTDGQTGDEFGLAGSAPLKLLPGFEYDFSFHYKAEGLLPETGDRSKYAALICDIFCNDEKRRIGGDRIMNTVNSADWARLSKRDLVIDEVPAKSVATVAREPKPDPKTRYAVNLLRNGEIEEGVDGKPVGWTHVGTPEPDWTQEAIARLHTHGRPDFSDGRSRGEWSRELTYSGQGALLNISVDPPNSPNHQWYGRNPVDGYWLSDPMPCGPGTAYFAAAWIKPGAVISEAWHGPLERPRTAENIWGVTPLVPVFGDGRPFEREMGEMMRVAGFGLAWVRLEASVSPDRLRQDLVRIRPVLVSRRKTASPPSKSPPRPSTSSEAEA